MNTFRGTPRRLVVIWTGTIGGTTGASGGTTGGTGGIRGAFMIFGGWAVTDVTTTGVVGDMTVVLSRLWAMGSAPGAGLLSSGVCAEMVDEDDSDDSASGSK